VKSTKSGGTVQRKNELFGLKATFLPYFPTMSQIFRARQKVILTTVQNGDERRVKKIQIDLSHRNAKKKLGPSL